MSWGTKRRNFILFIVALVILTPLAFIIFFMVYEPPSCTDGKHNGNEEGVDCGGSCPLICSEEAIDPIVLWKRYFPVSPGFYNVIAMVENPNPSAGLEEVSYSFKLFDNKNVLLSERRGKTKIHPKTTVPIMESALNTGALVPRIVTFELEGDLVWSRDLPVQSTLVVSNQEIIDEDTSPRINATVKNLSLETFKDVDVIAIVYDNRDNAIGSSSTYIPSIGKDQSMDIVFTWPQPFTAPVTRIEVIPVYESDQ